MSLWDREHPKDAYLRDQFRRMMESLEQEILPADEIVAEAFLGTDRHLTEEDLVRLVQEDHPEIDAPLVRRAMRLLCDLGIAQRVRLGENVVYEHLHAEQHHDHMVCARCGAVREFESARIQEEALRRCREQSFRPLLQRLTIHGICAACAGQMPATRSLASCLQGETVEVAEIAAGHGLKHRLTELGFTRGTVVRVLSAQGPVALEVRGSRVVLGPGQAAKIMVRALNGGAPKEET
jgi:Fur family ferric uptake transcriptional regulator